jgi:hypothetical protein
VKPEDFGDVFNHGYLSALKHCYRLLVVETHTEIVKKLILREASQIKLQQQQKGSSFDSDVNSWVHCNE